MAGGKADFPPAFFSLLESAQALAGTARAAGELGKTFPVEICWKKPFQQRGSDSHSLLEFPGARWGGTSAE